MSALPVSPIHRRLHSVVPHYQVLLKIPAFCCLITCKIQILAVIITSLQSSRSWVGHCNLLFKIQQSSTQKEVNKSELCREPSRMSWHNCLCILPWSHIEIFHEPRNLADVRAVNNVGGILQMWEILSTARPAHELSTACASQVGVRRSRAWQVD